jgi:hypothetical protein
MSEAFVGLLLIITKCMVQTANKKSYDKLTDIMITANPTDIMITANPTDIKITANPTDIMITANTTDIMITANPTEKSVTSVTMLCGIFSTQSLEHSSYARNYCKNAFGFYAILRNVIK